jgi:hypothetical protein
MRNGAENGVAEVNEVAVAAAEAEQCAAEVSGGCNGE